MPAIIKDCLLIKVMLQESVEEKYVVTIHWPDEHHHKHWDFHFDTPNRLVELVD